MKEKVNNEGEALSQEVNNNVMDKQFIERISAKKMIRMAKCHTSNDRREDDNDNNGRKVCD